MSPTAQLCHVDAWAVGAIALAPIAVGLEIPTAAASDQSARRLSFGSPRFSERASVARCELITASEGAKVRRLALLMVVGSLAVFAVAVPGVAITNGVVDGDGHPSVGGLVASSPYSDGTWIYCSGTLIAPKVFLTAAHCDDDGASVTVTFDTAYEGGDPTYTGTFHADPVYAESYRQNDPHDIAVVVLDEAPGITPADLPEAGSLSVLSRGQTITSVGYGAYDVSNAPGGKVFSYDDVRMTAVGSLRAVNKAWLRVSMNPATGDGGTCYGDSGGPNFLGDTDVIAATTITGDAVCRSTNTTYRLDTPSARAFLSPFLGVVLP